MVLVIDICVIDGSGDICAIKSVLAMKSLACCDVARSAIHLLRTEVLFSTKSVLTIEVSKTM